MEYEPKRGQALVIVTPPGFEKTTWARNIAEQLGSFVETDFRRLDRRRGLNALLASEPRTVICDGIPESEAALARLKSVITSETVLVKQKCGASELVKTPHFIFCCRAPLPLRLRLSDIRFHVIALVRSSS